MKVQLIVFVCALSMLGFPAMASVISYGDLPGGPGEVSFLGIEEGSITDPLPLFGAPTRVGNTLLFFPTTFASFSTSNMSDVTSGTLKMQIDAAEGQWLTTILINEIGDYSLLGLDAQASISGLLTITDLVHGTLLYDALTVAPGMNGVFSTANDDSNGAWTATTTIALPSVNDMDNRTNSIMIVFNNTLQTSAGENSTAFIQKKPTRKSITVETPEPATLALLVLGSIALLRRKH